MGYLRDLLLQMRDAAAVNGLERHLFHPSILSIVLSACVRVRVCLFVCVSACVCMHAYVHVNGKHLLAFIGNYCDKL